MGNKMLIDASHSEETRVVVAKNNKILEFDFESASRKPLKGNIYLAKVTRVEPSLQAAFVEYGGNRHGFLAFAEIHPDYYQIPIADRLALLKEQEEEAAAEAAEEDEEDDLLPPDDPLNAPIDDQPDEPMEFIDVDPADIEAALAESGIEAQPPESEAEIDEAVEASKENEEDAEVAAPTEGEEETSPKPRRAPRRPRRKKTAEMHRDDGDDVLRDDAPEHVAEQAEDTKEDAQETESADEETSDFNLLDDSPQTENAPPAEEGAVIETLEADPEVTRVESVGAEDALEELPQRKPRRQPRRRYKIQEVIKRRQILLVQVVKEERGNKGAALTTYLSLAGRYCVLMPNTARGGGISRKITDAGDRRRLKELARDIEVPQGMGLIVRTAGAQRTKPEIKRDFDYLIRLWESVRDLTLQSQAPSLVYEEGSLIKRSIRDLYTKDVDEIVVEGAEAHREARDFMKMLMPSHVKNVKLHSDARPVFAKFGVENQLDALYSPTVTLPSGGYIVINQTEALVAIDINSGKATREHSIEDTAHKTNLEACDEIGRQLRLRDLAGLVVIDFIDMEEHRNNRSVERRLKEALKHDRARIQVGRISPFGLLEMSRQRLRPGLTEGTFRTCPHCEGRGIVRSVSSCGLGVLRSVEEYLQNRKPENLNVKCHRDVAFYLLNEKRDSLLALEQAYGVTIYLISGGDDLRGNQSVIERASDRESAPRRVASVAPVRIDSALTENDEPTDEELAEEENSFDGAEPEEPRESTEASEEDGQRDRGRRRRRGRRGGRGRDRFEDGPRQPASNGESNIEAESEVSASEDFADAEPADPSADDIADLETLDGNEGPREDGERESGQRNGRGRDRGRRNGRFGRGRDRGRRRDWNDRERPAGDAPQAANESVEESESKEPVERAERADRGDRGDRRPRWRDRGERGDRPDRGERGPKPERQMEYTAPPPSPKIEIPEHIADPEPRKWAPPTANVAPAPAAPKKGWWSKRTDS